MLDLIGVLVLIHQNQIHLVAHQPLQRRVLVNRHHGLIQHIGITDPTLAFTPLLKAVEQINEVLVLVRIPQLLKHDLRR